MLLALIILFLTSTNGQNPVKKSFSCDEPVEYFGDYAYLSSPNYPQNIDAENRENCVFNFTQPGNYVFVFTNGNICDATLVLDGKINQVDLDEMDSYRGTTFAMFLNQSTTLSDCDWQAFQAVIYNFTDDSIVPRIPLSELFRTNLAIVMTLDLPKKWLFMNDIPTKIELMFYSEYTEVMYGIQTNICNLT
uniref:CUB domain-containing protein n=1 Tax=Panagrolaimus sp. JU765 TaxID=591449 RepID=A0AC34RGE4_9BILA